MKGKRVWVLWTREIGPNGKWERWRATAADMSRDALWSQRWSGDGLQCRVTYAVAPYPIAALKRDGGKER